MIKDFIFNETIEFPLDAYFIDDILNFLDNTYGFAILFSYLQEKVKYIESQNEYFGFPFHKRYHNPQNSIIQNEVHFITVIEWYADLSEQANYHHKKLLEFLSPNTVVTSEFKAGFYSLIEKGESDLKKIIKLCMTLDVFEIKDEFILSILIEISNTLCNKFGISQEDLVQIFGANFAHNMGMKSGTAGMPFPQDLRKRELINIVLDKYDMHYEVKELFMNALKHVEEDIKEAQSSEYNEKW